ncbi:MAG: SDR family NAD(P)-dependent oxidoreductase, partial [Bacteroidales bacterium]
MQKTVFITGSSSGIGKAAVKYFAQKGWNVAATMRNPSKEKELNTLENVKLFTLDVTNSESIQKAIADAIECFGGIDVIINNAGYGGVGIFEAAQKEQIQRQ